MLEEKSMLLSMSLLSDYLRDYRQEISICKDSLSIRGLRYIPTNGSVMKKDYVYICSSREYFNSSTLADAYMLVNEHSYLIFYDCDYEILLNNVLRTHFYLCEEDGCLLTYRVENSVPKDSICQGKVSDGNYGWK